MNDQNQTQNAQDNQNKSIAETCFIVSSEVPPLETVSLQTISPETATPDHATRLELVETANFASWQKNLSTDQQAWLERQNFVANSGQIAWLEDGDGPRVVIGWDGKDDLNSIGGLPFRLPEGNYAPISTLTNLQLIGWGLGSYQFTRYKAGKRLPARIVIPADNQADKIANTTDAVALARDLINTPAQDMAPAHMEAEVRALADTFDASCESVTGDELLDNNCGAIHAVGRAADDPPRLIDLYWGDPSHPKVTLVGKGITFDSGGLNIKPASSMRLMKKDMGGAATVIGLAYLIMAQNLPVRLRLMVAAAENAISGNAFRPGDILHTHKGLTVEIDNTDAEGRLVLCDALSIASDDNPDLLFDYATLTGSARSAVGAEIGAMFCNDDKLADALGAQGEASDDLVWRMPLHDGYNHMIDSKVADLVNSAASPYAGSITAALFLKNFVSAEKWAHFDIMAFNTRSRPGRPEGGEAMALRAVFDHLEETYLVS